MRGCRWTGLGDERGRIRRRSKKNSKRLSQWIKSGSSLFFFYFNRVREGGNPEVRGEGESGNKGLSVLGGYQEIRGKGGEWERGRG